MRINVYTEELLTGEDALPFAEIVTADYISSRTGEPMTNYGLRVYLKSPPELHYIPGRDDDRSAVTFWCGSNQKNVFQFIEMVQTFANESAMKLWRDKTARVNEETVEAERLRNTIDIEPIKGTIQPGDTISGPGYPNGGVVVDIDCCDQDAIAMTGPRHRNDQGRMIACLDFHDGKCQSLTHMCIDCPDRTREQDTFGGPRPELAMGEGGFTTQPIDTGLALGNGDSK